MLGATTMLDTDATVTTGLRPSSFDRLPSSFGDPDQTDLDRLAASPETLKPSNRPFVWTFLVLDGHPGGNNDA